MHWQQKGGSRSASFSLTWNRPCDRSDQPASAADHYAPRQRGSARPRAEMTFGCHAAMPVLSQKAQRLPSVSDGSRFCCHHSSAPDQGHRQIVDIGPGRSGHQKTADPLQRMIRIIFRQHLCRIIPCRTQRRIRVLVDKAAGCVGRPVCPIRAKRADSRILRPPQPRCGRKRQLLIPPAEAPAGQVDDRLAACDIGQLFPVPRVGASRQSVSIRH